MPRRGGSASGEPWVLGFSASHNGSVCLLRGDEVFCAVQEERLTGLKREAITRLEDSLAFRYCLDAAGITPDDLDVIVGCYFSGKPRAGESVVRAGWAGASYTIPHHLGHAIGAFVQSGFSDALVLVVDGQGGALEWLPAQERRNLKLAEVPGLKQYVEIISIYRAAGRRVECLEKHGGQWLPDFHHKRQGGGLPRFGSLGGLYSAAAQKIFGDANDAGKVMGLAALGEASVPVEAFFRIEDDGRFRFSEAARAGFAFPERWPQRRQELADLAASVQAALEVGILDLVDRTHVYGGSERLCYAGGVALNCVANERIIREKPFEEVFIMPAAEDSGAAIGAAYHGLWQLGRDVPRRRLVHDSTGRRYHSRQLSGALQRVPWVEVEEPRADPEKIVDALCNGEILGWFQGGSELGPRALGQRSILADPRPAEAKDRLNERVKHRESFRPFAPLVLAEHANDWFELPDRQPESPFMLRAFRFRPERAEQVPAVVHHDGTGRLQTVTAQSHPQIHALLQAFHARTGVPILVNTSFNVMGEPIVETPEDALFCLLFTDLDGVVLEDRLVRRAAAFTDFLDLRVKRRQVGLRFEMGAGQWQEFGDLSRAELKVLLDGRWGVHRLRLAPSIWPVLALADGELPAREIHAVLCRRRPPGPDRFTFMSVLRFLRRAGVVDLLAPP